MKTVVVKKNTSGDTRVAKGVPSFEEFREANRSHQLDVTLLCSAFSGELVQRALKHDWTKTEEPYQNMFYHDLCETIKGNMQFMDGEWSKIHYYELERHHLIEHAPDDVNLFDVVEMLCDCVAAGVARSGEVYDINIPDETLKKAVKNTVEYLKSHVVVEE